MASIRFLTSSLSKIVEIRAMRLEIKDPKMAKCVDSWEEAINSPELATESRIKVTIGISMAPLVSAIY